MPARSVPGKPRRGLFLRRWLGPGTPKVESRELGEPAFSAVSSSAALLPAEVCVVDALDSPCEMDPESLYQQNSNEIRAVARSRVVDLQLPNPGRIRVREQALILEAGIRQLKTVNDALVQSFRIDSLAHIAVRSLKVFNEAVQVKGDPAANLLPIPAACEATEKMKSFPYVRRGLPPVQVSPDIVESFLHEARELKGVPEGEGEFLALFRHIPVALISRVRFLEDSAVLLYTVAPARGPLTVRLHDLAAVRDRSKGVVHLVVHRTKNCVTQIC